MISTGVLAVEISSNSKIKGCSCTMSSQTSCPTYCPFLNSGCYAESGMQAIWTRKLNKSTRSIQELAEEEAEAIRANLSGKRNLRLHIVGDCSDNFSAIIVSEAAEEYKAKHNKKVWTYSHAWKNVRRSSWRSVSVLASCETTTQAKQAMSKGYAACITMIEFKDTMAWTEDGVKIVPCPEQTGKAASCDKCKLCWNDKFLRENNTVIGFAAHSQGQKKLKEKLINIKVNNETNIQMGL